MYIVKTASELVCGTARFGRYLRVAVIQLAPGYSDCAVISDRARGVVRVVKEWRRLIVGSTSDSPSALALAEAEALCAELNSAF